MFLPLEIDVLEHLVEGTNHLRVEFAPALHVGEERRSRYFKAHQLESTTARFDARAFVRKAQYMFGWDWGPSLISCGIYRPVSLIEYEGRITFVQIEQRHESDGTVSIRMTTEGQWPSTFVDPTQRNEADETAEETSIGVYHFIEGYDTPVRDGQWFRIEKPRLWWPHGLGTAELYEIVSILCVGRPRLKEIDVHTLDRKVQRIGLRELVLRQEPDEFGRSFQFVVNGRKMYSLGANWIPNDSFVSRIDTARLRAQLERAVDLEMNTLRVWGGGFYESDEFFDACDELGLLVWQDLPYACSYYPDDEEACSQAIKEATFHVKRLRNHPSLLLYCGNNENDMMRDDLWDGANRHPPRYEGVRIYREVLPSVIAKLDPSRPYIPSSPFGEKRANDGSDGDQHYWDVWHGRGDYCHYLDSQARFCSEFGFASAPGHATWRVIEPAENLLEVEVRDARARWHDKTAKGYETFLGYVALHYPASETLEEWTYFSQLNQRDALRVGIEHFRRSQFCRGTLIWQLNDCWPVQSWAVIDSLYHYKAAAYELRRLYAPLLGSIERVNDHVRLWAILDNVSESVTADFTLELRSFHDGALLSSLTKTEDISPDERRVILELSLDNVDESDTVVLAWVDAQQSFLLLTEPKNLNLSSLALSVEVFSDYITVTLDGPVIDLCLWDDQGSATFYDNFVTKLSPGTIDLRYCGTLTQIHARSLGGRHDVLLKKSSK
jgi:beta-mannosidase